MNWDPGRTQIQEMHGGTPGHGGWLDGTRETEVSVGDFATPRELLARFGMQGEVLARVTDESRAERYGRYGYRYELDGIGESRFVQSG